MDHLRILQQGLGGNATPVQAHTAQVFLFNQRRFQSQLARPDRGHISAGTPTNDDHIKVLHEWQTLS